MSSFLAGDCFVLDIFYRKFVQLDQLLTISPAKRGNSAADPRPGGWARNQITREHLATASRPTALRKKAAPKRLKQHVMELLLEYAQEVYDKLRRIGKSYNSFTCQGL